MPNFKRPEDAITDLEPAPADVANVSGGGGIKGETMDDKHKDEIQI